MDVNEIAVEYTKALINHNVKAQDHFGRQIIDAAPSIFRAAHAAADVINAEDQLWRAQLLDSAQQTVLNKKGCSDFVAKKVAELSDVAAEIGSGLTQNEHGNPIDARCLAQCLDANKHMLHFNNKESEVSHDAAYYAELLSSYAPRSENWHELGQAMALKDLEKLIGDPSYQPDNISPESLKSTHETEREPEDEFGMSM